MNLLRIRQSLHHLYTLLMLALIATGLLLGYPDWRAQLVGGYGREIYEIHLWVGWAFMGVPVLALLVAALPLLRDLRRRLGPPDGVTWRKIHTVFTLAAGVLLAVSGVVLWLDPDLPLPVLDATVETHEVLTWMVLIAIAAHLVLAWRKTVARTREILGFDSQPLFPFDHEDADESEL
jgi:cytochrome b subunit of formate dehydrogenase